MLQNVIVRKGSSQQVPKFRWKPLVVILAICGSVTAAGLIWRQTQVASSPQPEPTNELAIATVTALGKLVPSSEVIKLSAPTSSQENRVERLLVKEGDRIKAGTAIAILDSHDRLKAAVAEAQEQVNVARTKLQVIQAGAKLGEINAQRAEVVRLEAEREGNIDAQSATADRLELELRNAQTEYSRYESLYTQGVISASQRDSKQLTLDTARKNLQSAKATLDRIRSTSPAQVNQAKSTLERIAEVRPVDIRAAQAEVDRAIALRNQAKANLEQSLVRSPVDGEVLYVHTRSGEVVSNDGIVEIGQTRQMKAIAEVYQSDVGKVLPGQRVRVKSAAISGELTGTVERVSSQVRRQTIVNTDPSTNIDARVVEVHAKLDNASSQKAAKFTNLQVQMVIEK
jgi:HlyD family secretion protein